MALEALSILPFAFLSALGLIMGSFLGTLVICLPAGRPFLLRRSTCDSCGEVLAPWQLIPVASWLFQNGKCSRCGSKISVFFPLIEIAAAVVTVWAGALLSGPALLLTLVLGWGLLVLALTDIRILRLFDAVTLPLLGIGLAGTWVLSPECIIDHGIGAAIGFAGFVLIGACYKGLRHRPGLGFGDAKLLAAAGAWVGWQGLPSVVLIAAAGALLAVLAGQIGGLKIHAQTKLPFGAFLCLGLWIVWLYGPIVW
jgi:leader peptidase (prepilin peptidase) / N-methyltransferase